MMFYADTTLNEFKNTKMPFKKGNDIMKTLPLFFYEWKRFGFSWATTHLLLKYGMTTKEKYADVQNKFYLSLKPKDYEKELREWYRHACGRDPKYIDNPVTFNDKIQWLKLYDSTPEKTRLADKYLVREWIREQIGEEYLIPIYGNKAYHSFEEIDFEQLPKQFVIKANHASGMIMVVKDKSTLNLEELKQTVDKWMHTTFGYRGMETHYFNIPPRIIIEEYIEELDGDLHDYKIHCFNGEPKFIQVFHDRDISAKVAWHSFYDLDWNHLDFTYTHHHVNTEPTEKPPVLEEMIQIAKKLSTDFKYVRVDLYLLGDKIKFGEMTFTPENGQFDWKPPEINETLGNMLSLE